VIIELLEAINNKKDLRGVKGIAFRQSDYHFTSDKLPTIIKTERNPRIEDIDSLPIPAWDLFPIENYLSRNYNYHIQRGRTLPILASRG